MRLALMLGLSFVMLACPGSFKAKNPPCESNADCSVEELGSDFPDHVCRASQCYPSASAPGVEPGGDTGPQSVYDAGAAVDTGRTVECRQDEDCEAGEVCIGGYCLESGVPPRPEAGNSDAGGPAPELDAGTPDAGPPAPVLDAGGPTPPNGSSADLASQSCSSLLADYPELQSGSYWVDPDGAGPVVPIEVFCDMETGGGGWTLVLQRRVGNSNTESCGANLDEFVQGACGTVGALAQTDSYSIGRSSRQALVESSSGHWLVVQYGNNNIADPNDAFTLRHDGDVFDLFSEMEVVDTPVQAVCDQDGANCVRESVSFRYAGIGSIQGASCSGVLANETGSGVYGYCTALEAQLNHGFGDRSGAAEIKVWGVDAGGVSSFSERVLIK